ncbi:MAG: PEP-CTERM sorting domain-containing protein [Opitutaceae bacterium]|nr:PEP-CTERM sorting domain-containing protein [Opitutaceae bacterium]
MNALRPFVLASSIALAVPAAAQVSVVSNYSQDFNSLGSGLPAGWGVWTSSSSTSNGLAFNWSTTQIANDASAGATTYFRNLPGASQTWSAGLSAGSDRALGWRAGDLASRNGSITFTLSNTTGWSFDNLSFQVFTPNSSGSTASFQFQYQAGTSGTFTNFSPTVSYTTVATPAAGVALSVISISLTSSQLSAISNQSGQVTLRFDNTATSGTSWNSLALDNFSYGASAVPEPSTYAAIAGAVALCGAAWHRRRQRQLAIFQPAKPSPYSPEPP